jgi:hypothetical protein
MPGVRRWPFVALITAAVFVLLRAPSLIEPPTFNDEGSYADIGWALDHGAVLYRNVWDNKPPGVYWLAAAINLVHTSVLAFHVVVAIVVVATAVALWFLCRRLASSQVAWAATLAIVVLASLPTLAGDVLNAEVVGALCATLAMLLVVGRGAVTRPAAVTSGLLLAAALLCKATFVVDLIAVATVPAWLAMARGNRAGGAEATAAAMVLAGAAALLGVCAVALAIGGSLPGLADVLAHQDLAYVQTASAGAAGAGGSAATGAGGLLTFMTASRVAVVLMAGGAVTWRLARGRHIAATVGAWWVTWDLAAVVLSARGLDHYVQQAEPAMCLCAALVAAKVLRRWTVSATASGALAAVAAWGVSVGALIAPTAEASLAVPQPLSSLTAAIVSPHVVTHYLGQGWERLTGSISPASYDAGFGPEPALVTTVVSVIDAHSRVADRVFVWGRVPWAYALSARLPAGRYVSLNASYALDPGSQERLIDELAGEPPAVLVALDPLPAQVTGMVEGLGYREIVTPLVSAPNGRVVSWIAPWQ